MPALASGPSPQLSTAPTEPPTSALSTARPAASSSPSGAGIPVTVNRLRISSLHVDAPIIDESIHGNELNIPSDVHTVGHWNGGGAITGGIGTVLIAGHVNYTGQGNGALYQLAQIKRGAEVQTIDAASVPATWRVTSVRLAEKSALPQDIFTAVGPRRLVVVTCGGALVHVAGSGGGYDTYQDNVIVTAIPA
jgi:hypothetical protein